MSQVSNQLKFYSNFFPKSIKILISLLLDCYIILNASWIHLLSPRNVKYLIPIVVFFSSYITKLSNQQ